VASRERNTTETILFGDCAVSKVEISLPPTLVVSVNFIGTARNGRAFGDYLEAHADGRSIPVFMAFEPTRGTH